MHSIRHKRRWMMNTRQHCQYFYWIVRPYPVSFTQKGGNAIYYNILIPHEQIN